MKENLLTCWLTPQVKTALNSQFMRPLLHIQTTQEGFLAGVVRRDGFFDYLYSAPLSVPFKVAQITQLVLLLITKGYAAAAKRGGGPIISTVAPLR